MPSLLSQVKQQLNHITWVKHVNTHRCPYRFFSLKDALNLSSVNKAYHRSVSKELAEAEVLTERGALVLIGAQKKLKYG